MDALLYVAIGVVFGGLMLATFARLRFGAPRLGVVWWAGMAITAAGFLGMLAIGYLSR